jgi:hypothetical protein
MESRNMIWPVETIELRWSPSARPVRFDARLEASMSRPGEDSYGLASAVGLKLVARDYFARQYEVAAERKM